MTWAEMKVKYPEYRDEMSETREREFVADCFDAYEQNDKLAKTFWSPFGDYKELIGKRFSLKGRCDETDSHLSALPMWNIVIEDGTEIGAYPEEIFLREQIDNGRSKEEAI